MNILVILSVCVWVVFLLSLLRMAYLALQTLRLIKNTTPFSRSLPQTERKILILGDSTAYGTGTETPLWSTAGRIGILYPDATIVNRSVNGLRIAGLLKLMENFEKEEHYEIILIQIGANDIMRLTSMRAIELGITTILSQAQIFGTRIILLHSGDIWKAKFFPFYLKPLLSRRSLQVRSIYQKVARQYWVLYVDFISSPIADLFNHSPRTYYASDSLHPTSSGYWLWFTEIEKFLPV